MTELLLDWLAVLLFDHQTEQHFIFHFSEADAQASLLHSSVDLCLCAASLGPCARSNWGEQDNGWGRGEGGGSVPDVEGCWLSWWRLLKALIHSMLAPKRILEHITLAMVSALCFFVFLYCSCGGCICFVVVCFLISLFLRFGFAVEDFTDNLAVRKCQEKEKRERENVKGHNLQKRTKMTVSK